MALRTPIVAIVGRPNVGKSTLFNAITGSNQAVVEDEPGVTRDRNYAPVERYSVPFVVVDTGGFEKDSNDPLAKLVSEQVQVAIEEADIIYALFDGNAGLHPGDRDIVELLRPLADRGKPVYFIVNKCDGKEQHLKLADFYALGIEPLQDISARYGHGVNPLVEGSLEELDNYEALKRSWHDRKERQLAAEREANERVKQIVAELAKEEKEEEAAEVLQAASEPFEPEAEPVFAPVFVPGESLDSASGIELSAEQYQSTHRLRDIREQGLIGSVEPEETDEEKAEIVDRVPDEIRVAIVGKPNVGKSTLVNTLSGEQRTITSDIAGTTRDSLNLELKRDGQKYILVDTAGIRKKARIGNRVEQYSAMRTLRALSECDVAVVVIDASDGPSAQDVKIAGIAHDQGRGLVIAVNKWDLVEKDNRTVKKFTDEIRREIKFAPYASIVFISAKSGRRCPRIIEAVKQAATSRERRVPTGMLNKVLRRAVVKNSLPVYRGRPLKLYFAAQVGTAPPRFVLFFNHPRAVHFSYLRFLKNAIREEFGFEGTDIKLSARKHNKKA